jgi:Endodeoxyribonuclease RusA
MILVANLPLPPSANNLFATYNGRRIISRAYKAWKKLAGPILLEQWEEAQKPDIGKPYAVHIELNVNHQSDIANREKAITDLLVSTIPGFPGDQWVDRMLIVRNRDIEAARVEVVSLPSMLKEGECDR